MSFEKNDIDRKVLAILKILHNSREVVGARVLARNLENFGIRLGERAVRYHLRIMDEKGLTRPVGRDGREITDLGVEELKKGRVTDKVGLAISRIELLSFRTDFNLKDRTGHIPMNISYFPEERFDEALEKMQPVFDAGLCVSDMVAVFHEGEPVGESMVPEGMKGLATVCSVVVNGALLKAGIPVDSRFGGLLEVKNGECYRFSELIHYAGSSLDPSEVYIRAHMTSVNRAVAQGSGEILANFREIPAECLDVAQDVQQQLKRAGINGIYRMGDVSEPICEIPVDLNRVGIVLIGGLNPVAVAHESGIEVESHAMSVLVDYNRLENITKLRMRGKLYGC